MNADGTARDDDDELAIVVTRYEQALADGAPTDLNLSHIEDDPALLDRWQSAKSCLELIHRVRQQESQVNVGTPPSAIEYPDTASLTGLNLPKSLGRF
jgi:hypothetical protein